MSATRSPARRSHGRRACRPTSRASNRGVAALRALGLAYDVLVYEHQLETATVLVDRHPEQVFVVDHVAKPRIRDAVLSPWRERMRELARRPNVFCKLSGMVTEADPRAWTRAALEPYAELVLSPSGPRA